MDAIRDIMPAGVEFGEMIKFQGLGVLPILNGQAQEIDLLTLDEALNQGAIEIREINEGSGSVPFLDVENRGEKPILILDGEELIGGLQCRIVNTTVLLTVGASVRIVVSCIERGRFNRLQNFTSGKIFRASGRAVHKQGVAESIQRQGIPLSNQGAVWNQVQRTLNDVGARSRTENYGDARQHVEHRVEEFVQAIRPVEHQIGGIWYGERGMIRGAEWLVSPTLYFRCHEKIVSSFAFDALNAQPINGVSPDPVKAWWNEILSAPISRRKAIGAGDHVQTEGTKLIGTGLLHERRLIHFSCFPLVSQLPLDQHRKTNRSSAKQRMDMLRSKIER